MAGIYIHIPFCRKICGYCDFYRINNTELLDTYVPAILEELNQRKEYLGDQTIETIYFGGGTPSLLSINDLNTILSRIYGAFTISDSPEITIEVNPDDFYDDYPNLLKNSGINRISIGVQSWDNGLLKKLNRRHDAARAESAVNKSRQAGLNNISVDLIYGIPGMTTDDWEQTLKKTFALDIRHLSAYHLSIEKGTPFFRMLKNGLISEIEEEESNSQFLLLTKEAEGNGYIHYEISNLCKEGFYSLHNTNYWKQIPYIGLGPSAHSFNGYSRQWNISDVKKYIASMKKGVLLYEREELNSRTKFNEYIMTSLRTMWGIDLDYVETEFDKEGYDYITNIAGKFISYGMLKKENNTLILTRQGIMISDNIISEFLMIT